MTRHHPYRIYLYLFFLLMSVGGLIGMPFWFHRDHSAPVIRESLEKMIHSREQFLEERMEEIIFKLFSEVPGGKDTLTMNSFWIQPILGTDPLAENMVNDPVFIFQQDSLIYWSSNQVPEMEAFSHITDRHPVMEKRSNGWYLLIAQKYDDLLVVVASLVKQQYPFQNQYLQNNFPHGHDGADAVNLRTEKGAHNIYASDGSFLCSLHFPPGTPGMLQNDWMIMLLMLAYLFWMLWSVELFFFHRPVKIDVRWRVAIIIGGVWLLRLVQYSLEWPGILMDSGLFEKHFADGIWLTGSLGDFILNGFLLLASAYLLMVVQRLSAHGKIRKLTGKGSLWWRILLSILLLGMMMAGIHQQVCQNPDFLNLEIINRFSWQMVPSLIGLGFWLLGMTLLLMVLATLSPSFPRFITVLVLVTICSTVVLHDANKTREFAFRDSVAARLIQRENPLIEEQLDHLAKLIPDDARLQAMMRLVIASLQPASLEDSVSHYVQKQYFDNTWNNFTIQITICTPQKELNIQPQNYVMPCDAYFSEIQEVYGTTTPYPAVWFLDYSYGNEDYLIRISNQEVGWNMYIELSSRAIYKGTGYPELLVDRSSYDFPSLDNYSFAFYENSRLVHRVGSFRFGMDLTALADTTSLKVKALNDGMDHRLFPVNGDVVLLISMPEVTWLNLMASFSYLLLFLLVMSGVGYGILHIPSVFSWRMITLRSRLQATMLGLILISFIVLGAVTVVNLVSINNQKNRENLMERSLSILVEMEHKLDYIDQLDQVAPEEVEALLVKFSNVFFSDINLYTPEGRLFASSRPRIFREGLISDRINPRAMILLKEQKTGMFVQTESIGKLSYLSAYIPFYNSRDRLLGYLNLPYFSRQDDLRREISSFLVAFINIYVLFILFGLIAVYFIGNYITAPLKLLASRLGKIRFGESDDKLTWKHQDEIGQLVTEYNAMLDKLVESAEKLAVSERESAWREMAQQVAHEIKNPLTPMKLSVQHLLHTWKDHPDDWNERLERFAEALISQIETLSRIASEFSYFAQMPQPENRCLNLDDLVNNTLALYQDLSGIHFERSVTPGDKWIFADRNQILRVFGNVVNNAVQALEGHPDGVIRIILESEGKIHRIVIEDNGKGIAPEEATKIFQPRFTTRSGGTGLGLAIVREILLSAGGEITFASAPGEKTRFEIQLPACDPPQNND